jgi:hypothetical protein
MGRKAKITGNAMGYTSAVLESSREWLRVDPGRGAGPGYLAPRQFTARYEQVGLPPVVLEIVVGDDRVPSCLSIRNVVSDGRPGLTTALLRRLALQSIAKELLFGAGEKVDFAADERVVGLLPMTLADRDIFLGDPEPPLPPLATSRVSNDVLEEVARIYRANPKAPTRAVEETLPTSRATAGRYVAEARNRGLLGSPIPRKAGEGSHPGARRQPLGVGELTAEQLAWAKRLEVTPEEYVNYSSPQPTLPENAKS